MTFFIYGYPASGKTTIGLELSKSLELPFVDLDADIEKRNDKTIPQIMEEGGESAFREAEANALRSIEGEKVVALGAGALLREENRRYVEERGKIVFLEAPTSTLLERLRNDKTQRPLLAGNIEERLEALMSRRREHYDSFALRVDTGNGSPKEIVWEIQKQIGRFRLRGMGAGYDVIVQPNALELLPSKIAHEKVVIVSDTNVAPIYGERVKRLLRGAELVVIQAGEKFKTLETVSFLWKSFLEHGLDRKSLVVALGGGVVGDLAGFAASTFMRGIDWIYLPTSLLAMVDASLGGKTGFDLREGKNLIGSFHPPRLVLTDASTLKTLPAIEFRSGMAEVVKHGVIGDAELYKACSRVNDIDETIRRAAAVKINIIEQDPYEKGMRATLNFGHTIGHALEIVSGFKLRHGEAVSVGMVAEAQIAERLTVARAGLADSLAETLSALSLPIQISKKFSRDKIIHVVKRDKKRSGRAVRFALPVEIGRVKLVEVDLEAI